MPISPLPHRLPASALLLAALWPLPAAATLSALTEDEMSSVDGADGLEVVLSTPGWAMNSWQLKSDSTVAANAGGMQAAGLALAPFGGPTSLIGSLQLDVGANDNATTVLPAINLVTHLNQFRLGGAGNAGFVASVTGDATRNYGSWALVSGASGLDFSLLGQPFYGNPSSTTALNLSLLGARLFYRQNAYSNANLTFDNFNFVWNEPTATIDTDANGLRIAGDATFRIEFDLLYKYNADQDMRTVTANDRPLARLGWYGTLYDSLVYMRGGGIWNTASDAGTNATFAALPTTGRTAGVNFGLRWNYKQNPATNVAGANDFTWRLGHVTGDREYLEFGDWRNLEQSTGVVAGRYGFDFPSITFDTLNAGSDTNAGGSLCWGNSMTAAACSAGGGTLMALRAGTIEGYDVSINRSGGAAMTQMIRNGNLLAWSNSVKLYRFPTTDATPTLEGNYNWGLIYTLANINANIYFYPGGSESDTAGGSRNQGLIGDVLFMTQSPQVAWAPDNATNTTRWSQGSHFMIADTGAQMGIGLLGSSYLLASDDLRLWLKNTSSGEASPNNWGGGLDLFSPRTRTELKALFGGARLPTGQDLVKGANVDFNFEGLWNFRLSPPPTRTSEAQDFIAYSVAIRFRCGVTTRPGCANNAFAGSTGAVNFASGNGSYISIEEPGRAGVDLRFADMSGDIAWTEGTLQLRSATDTAADAAPTASAKVLGKQDLSLANKLLIGASAATRMNDAATGVGLGVGGAAGRTFTSNVQFGGNDMLSWAIPAASMYASFTLTPQQ